MSKMAFSRDGMVFLRWTFILNFIAFVLDQEFNKSNSQNMESMDWSWSEASVHDRIRKLFQKCDH